MRPPRIDGKSPKTPLTVVALSLALAISLGCASLPLGGFGGESYDYFAAPDRDDPWSPKITGWQRREQADVPDAVAPAQVAQAGSERLEPAADSPALRTKYSDFRSDQRRATAREFAEWIQDQAKHHYVADGPIDHWATLQETLRHDGDDCDGLELLVYHGLRDLGFGTDEVFRAIVVRPSDGQHHMVTLWFEGKDDPWVIDPTGAMTSGLHRMSEIPGWVPIKVFSEDREFTVRRALPTRDALAAR